MADKTIYVLDAFALMAYLSGEPSAERVRSILSEGEEEKCHIYISIINLGEVLYNMERNYGLSKAYESLTIIQSLPIEVLPADNQTVLAAAHIKANHPISYADAFVVVAAQKLNGIIMTGDPEFQDITELARIEWLKRRG
ncbi:MAG: type II toxin-antitoxin system VapC family toxin [Anaerolineae bacterium]|nr:type II toxin-antitoxin system VapC family toxin [Anaerolineae bacterium]MCI0611188.1 type II toxin-antitoxin system VapC family toxin [Anaerolineae bacterium]